MKSVNSAYLYAIVRFMPFVETREFANIGVAVIDPKTGKFSYKLAPKRFGRVTQFFDDLDGELYKNGVQIFDNELTRIEQFFHARSVVGQKLVDRFNELTRQRESVIHFGPLSTIVGVTSTKLLNSFINALLFVIL